MTYRRVSNLDDLPTLHFRQIMRCSDARAGRSLLASLHQCMIALLFFFPVALNVVFPYLELDGSFVTVLWHRKRLILVFVRGGFVLKNAL